MKIVDLHITSVNVPFEATLRWACGVETGTTRGIIEVLSEHEPPLGIVTKNALVERDLDILVPMARENLVQVFVSINSLDNQLAAKLEPRASAPHRPGRARREAGRR